MKERQKKRNDILDAMLYKNNNCNEELAQQIEKGGGYQFLDCPPILFSPIEGIDRVDKAKHQSHSSKAQSESKLMRSSLYDVDFSKEQVKKHVVSNSLWSVLANISDS